MGGTSERCSSRPSLSAADGRRTAGTAAGSPGPSPARCPACSAVTASTSLPSCRSLAHGRHLPGGMTMDGTLPVTCAGR